MIGIQRIAGKIEARHAAFFGLALEYRRCGGRVLRIKTLGPIMISQFLFRPLFLRPPRRLCFGYRIVIARRLAREGLRQTLPLTRRRLNRLGLWLRFPLRLWLSLRLGRLVRPCRLWLIRFWLKCLASSRLNGLWLLGVRRSQCS
jgi:hypothetical protein